MPPQSPSTAATMQSKTAGSSKRKRHQQPSSSSLLNFFAPRTGPVPATSLSPNKKVKEQDDLEWAIQESLKSHEDYQSRIRNAGDDNNDANTIDEGKDDVSEVGQQDHIDCDADRLPPPNMPPCMPPPSLPPDLSVSSAPARSPSYSSPSKSPISRSPSEASTGRNAFSLLMSNTNASSNLASLPSGSLSTLPFASRSLSASDADPLLTPSTLIKLWQQSDQIEARNKLKKGTRKRREIPFYKVLFGMPLSVDAFRFGQIEGCVGYFLSHAHSDHYAGLSPSWNAGPIYCSTTTGNLMISSLGVPEQYVHPLSYDEEWEIPQSGGVTVTLLPANHCPGSCVFLFKGPRTAYILPKPAAALGIPAAAPLPCIDPATGQEKQWHYLHCGDFRASPALLNHPSMKGLHLDVIYLDTTYLNPRYCFPAQEEVVRECAQCAWDNLGSNEEKLRAERQLREWERQGWKIDEEVGWRNIKGAREEREEARKRKFEEERRGMSGWLKGEAKVEAGNRDASEDRQSGKLAIESVIGLEGDADEEAAWREAHARLAANDVAGSYLDGEVDADELLGSNADVDNYDDALELQGEDELLRDLSEDCEGGETTNESGTCFEDQVGIKDDPDTADDHAQAAPLVEPQMIKAEPRTPSPPPPAETKMSSKAGKSPGVVGSRVLQALEFERKRLDEDEGRSPDEVAQEDATRIDALPFWRRLRNSRLEAGSSEYVDLDEMGIVVPSGQSRLPFTSKSRNVDQNASELAKDDKALDGVAVTVTSDPLKDSTSVPRPRGRLLIVVGTYSIGKEKIALSCALRLGTRIFCCSPSKYRIFSQLEDEPLLQSLLTTDPTKAQVHVTNLFSVSYESLRAHLDALRKGWGMDVDRCIAFRPTGWSYKPPGGTTMPNISLGSGRAGAVPDDVISNLVETNLSRPKYEWKRSFRPTRDSTAKIQMFGVPYSEHSSFFELTCFALSVRSWDRIVPTVNVGNKASRARMDAWIRAWKREREKRARKGVKADGGIVGRSAEYF